MPAVVLLSWSSAACSGTGSVCGPSEAIVAEVIDGDTVILDNGDRIRYLMIDAPEISGGENECFGIEARDFNRDLVLNKQVNT